MPGIGTPIADPGHKGIAGVAGIDPEVQPEEERLRLRQLAQQKALKKDSGLNAKFDKLLKSASLPKEKKQKPLKKRSQGRPKGGRSIFTQEMIASLTEFSHLSEVARRLNIKHTTLQQWCALEEHPLPFVIKGDHKLFRKDVLVKWLKATKRLEK